jgi:hypothetical protein
MLCSHGGGDRRARDAAAMAKRVVAARSSGGGRRRPGGPLWAAWPRSNPGWYKAFGPGGHSGLRWAKRPDRLGAMVGFVMKNQKNAQRVGCQGYRAELILGREEE